MDRYVKALHALIDCNESLEKAGLGSTYRNSDLASFAFALTGAMSSDPSNFTCKRLSDDTIPVGVSNRHVHLSSADIEILFGEGYQLKAKKDLSQPGQYAAEETVAIQGPKGTLQKVRILGPARNQTQIELLKGDCIKIGISSCLRESGSLKESQGVTLIGSVGSVDLDEGAIVAKRHIHMTPKDAEHFDVIDGDNVCIKIQGSRGGVYDQVIVRVSPDYALECHVDIEEANGMCIDSHTRAHIVRCS